MDDHTRQAVESGIEAIARAICAEGGSFPKGNGGSRSAAAQVADVMTRAARTQHRPDERNYLHIPIGTSIATAERWLVLATLEHCKGNKTRAAATLGISLKTLYNRLHAYHAETARPKADEDCAV